MKNIIVISYFWWRQLSIKLFFVISIFATSAHIFTAVWIRTVWPQSPLSPVTKHKKKFQQCPHVYACKYSIEIACVHWTDPPIRIKGLSSRHQRVWPAGSQQRQELRFGWMAEGCSRGTVTPLRPSPVRTLSEPRTHDVPFRRSVRPDWMRALETTSSGKRRDLVWMRCVKLLASRGLLKRQAARHINQSL